jgi:hypothetical protein
VANRANRGLNAYPVEAAIAEKFEAMVHLDMQNSRMRDFYDIWILSRTLAFSGLAAATSAEYPVRWEPLGPWQYGRSSKI